MADTGTKIVPNTSGLWDLAKIGVAFYIIGLLVTFIYYTQLQILSVDLVKPAAIILGIYVWALVVLLPRIVLCAMDLLKIKRSTVYNLFFALLLLAWYGWLEIAFNGWSWISLLYTVLAAGAVFIFYLNGSRVRHDKVVADQSLNRQAIFIVLFSILFSVSVYPLLPQYAGGGKPIVVKVYPKDRQLMLSQFSPEDYDADSCITANLLYEGNGDYYFIDVVNEQLSGALVEYRVHKVRKEEIKKIVYRRPFWINFK